MSLIENNNYQNTSILNIIESITDENYLHEIINYMFEDFENEYIVNNKLENLILSKDINKLKEECSICYEKINNIESQAIISCQHLFHDNCIKMWLNKKLSCPLCRKKPKLIKREKRN